MKGQCYCQRIQYELNATPIFVNACHCRDCQILTGSAFAINIMVEASAVKITSETQPELKTEDRLDKGPASDSKAYHCPSCGIMLWGTLGDFGPGLIFLRAGTLAENEKIVPSAHFFVRSKHPWVTIPEGVRTFETLPGENDSMGWTEEGNKRFKVATRKE